MALLSHGRRRVGTSDEIGRFVTDYLEEKLQQVGFPWFLAGFG